MAIERILTGSVREQLRDLMQTEDLVLEAVRDLVKDELKAHIKNKIDDDPELKEELRESLTYYFNAKARTVYAELKATRAAARLGLSILPDDLHEEVSEALVTLFERELGSVLERAL
ncbi:MAG: hypothetical protein QF707_01420 [Candidatus Poseidoniaceae archaeon]|nr:hypothetical protein [Candidatus Poseidoniaceae archaeon]MDP7203254.1 hypothetical protein [Candidatus Poseidoniaceae archaeon]